MQSRIMYIEYRRGEPDNDASIGRVTYSKSGKTLLYKSKRFKPMKGHGHNSNHLEESTGEAYWISGPRADGQDSPFAGRVRIDEDVREEYWAEIRKQPQSVNLRSYTTEGEHNLREAGNYKNTPPLRK